MELDFDGYAMGGFSVGEPKAVMWEMVDVAIGALPASKAALPYGPGVPGRHRGRRAKRRGHVRLRHPHAACPERKPFYA